MLRSMWETGKRGRRRDRGESVMHTRTHARTHARMHARTHEEGMWGEQGGRKRRRWRAVKTGTAGAMHE
jgi:hypothetical protein